MSERTLLRIGAVSAIVGALLLIAVNGLFPRVDDPSNVKATLQAAADSQLWRGLHVGLGFGVFFALGGFVALYRSITGDPGAALARLGFVSAVLGGALWFVTIAGRGFAFKAAADTWAVAPEAEKAILFRVAEAVDNVSFGLFTGAVFLFLGATAILYGLAVALSGVYPRWLGWVAVVGGVGSALMGIVQFYQGPSALWTNLLFGAFAAALTLWVLIMGVLMWRKASAG
ncbi:MAG: DUF4386 family protein [Chloroflexi bacterium]|nr:DUF4386 family protein [Chloroflexota bacterium]